MRTTTVVRVRPGVAGPHGDRAPGAPDVPLHGCVLAPGTQGGGIATSEDNDRAEQVEAQLVVYAPLDADVRATDQVRVPAGPYRGLWDVVGEPGRWQSPYRTARRTGTTIALTRTEG